MVAARATKGFQELTSLSITRTIRPLQVVRVRVTYCDVCAFLDRWNRLSWLPEDPETGKRRIGAHRGQQLRYLAGRPINGLAFACILFGRARYAGRRAPVAEGSGANSLKFAPQST